MCGRAFHLDDDVSPDDEVWIEVANDYTSMEDGDVTLVFVFDLVEVELDTQALLVDLLEQPWPERSMDLNGAADDAFCQGILEFHAAGGCIRSAMRICE